MYIKKLYFFTLFQLKFARKNFTFVKKCLNASIAQLCKIIFFQSYQSFLCRFQAVEYPLAVCINRYTRILYALCHVYKLGRNILTCARCGVAAAGDTRATLCVQLTEATFGFASLTSLRRKLAVSTYGTVVLFKRGARCESRVRICLQRLYVGLLAVNTALLADTFQTRLSTYQYFLSA